MTNTCKQCGRSWDYEERGRATCSTCRKPVYIPCGTPWRAPIMSPEQKAIRAEELRRYRREEECAVNAGVCVVCAHGLTVDERDRSWLQCLWCGHLVRASRPKCKQCGQPMRRNAIMRRCVRCRSERMLASGATVTVVKEGMA